MGEPASKRPRRADALPPLYSAVASSKGRKLTLEDVPVALDAMEGAEELAFYAIFDGHGGRAVADFAASRLPSLVAERVRAASDSPTVKEALRTAFKECDKETLDQAAGEGWDDGCCVISLLIDRRCTPARAYVANLGDSRAYACVMPPESIKIRAVALSKDHNAVDPGERKRIEAAGGRVEGGRVNGMLEVSRSLGDRKLKAMLKGQGLIASPDVTSFVIGPEQRFVLLACDGVWKVYSGLQCVETLHEALPKMDARRRELAEQLDDPVAFAGLTKETHATLVRERELANEEGCLRKLLHEAVHVRHAKDNCTMLLVRLPEALSPSLGKADRGIAVTSGVQTSS